MNATYTDVLIIGQGVIGASIAYHAVQHGLRTISVERVPAVGQQRLSKAWCGLEALSIDEIPYIGPGALEGLYLAFGGSGHGVAITPAIGRAVVVKAFCTGASS